MPKTLTRPVVGQGVWYYTAAPPTGLVPLPGVVLALVAGGGTGVGSPAPTYDLDVVAADGTHSKAAAVPFHYGTRPASGAWCTMPRVNVPASGQWPSSN